MSKVLFNVLWVAIALLVLFFVIKLPSSRHRWWHYLIGIIVIVVSLLIHQFTAFGWTWYGGGILIAIVLITASWLLRSNK